MKAEAGAHAAPADPPHWPSQVFFCRFHQQDKTLQPLRVSGAAETTSQTKPWAGLRSTVSHEWAASGGDGHQPPGGQDSNLLPLGRFSATKGSSPVPSKAGRAACPPHRRLNQNSEALGSRQQAGAGAEPTLRQTSFPPSSGAAAPRTTCPPGAASLSF